MWIHGYSLCLINTFLLDAFTTSSGKNLETDNNQSQNIRGMMILYGQNKDFGNSAIFHIEIQRRDKALHRVIKMYMHICLRLFCYYFYLCLFAVLAS